MLGRLNDGRIEVEKLTEILKKQFENYSRTNVKFEVKRTPQEPPPKKVGRSRAATIYIYVTVYNFINSKAS